MKIEISGSINKGAVCSFQNNFTGFIQKREDVISSFKTVRSKVQNVSGGVGNLQSGLNSLSTRITKEEHQSQEVEQVKKKANDFVDLAFRVDREVASLVNKNKEQFYQKYPHLRPQDQSEKSLYEKIKDVLFHVGDVVKDAIKLASIIAFPGGAAALAIFGKDAVYSFIDDLFSAAKDFYYKNKKVCDTILIVVGVVLSVAAVILTDGLALEPLLVAWGCSAGAAATASTVIGAIAVISSLGSEALNIIDIWCEIDNGVFNGFQTAFNISDFIFNMFYSVGGFYNAYKGIQDAELKAFRYMSTDEVKTAVQQDAILKAFRKEGIKKFGKDFDILSSNPEINTFKGNYGEMRMDQLMRTKGYRWLDSDAVKPLVSYDAPRGHGIDGLYVKGNNFADIVIGEAKFKSGSPNSLMGTIKNGSIRQMSDEWVDIKLDELVRKNLLTAEKRDLITGNYKGILFHINSDKKIGDLGRLTVYHLDDAGKITETWLTTKKTFIFPKIGVGWYSAGDITKLLEKHTYYLQSYK